MKSVLTILVLISGLSFAIGQSHPFEYLFPVPESRYHRPETKIILNPGFQLTEFDIQTLKRSKVLVDGIYSIPLKMNYLEDGVIIFSLVDSPAWNSWVHFSIPGINLFPDGFNFRYQIGSKPKEMSFAPEAEYHSEAVHIKNNDTIPEGFPVLDIEVFDGQFEAPLFLSPTSSEFKLMILSDNGIPVFTTNSMPGLVNNFNHQQGLLTYFQLYNGIQFYAMDSSYQVVDTFKCQNGQITDFHDMILLENGNAILLSYDQQQVDMSQMVPGGQPDAVVVGTVIQEVDPEDNVVFQWRSWDHYDILDAVHNATDTIDFTANNISYVHTNSLELDTDGHLIISNYHMNEVTKFSRTNGEIIWRMGGKNNEFTFVNDFPYGFTAQHDARRMPNGNISIFDNGLFHPNPFSRVVEYEIDTGSMTATKVREVLSPLGFPTLRTGNMQVLPNGNWLIGWGRANETGTFMITEHSPENELVFRLTAPTSTGLGYSYRAYKYAWPSKITTSIEGINFIENQLDVYPVPADLKVIFSGKNLLSPIQGISLYDIAGRLIFNKDFEGNSKIEISTADFPDGFYLYEARLKTGKLFGKFVIRH